MNTDEIKARAEAATPGPWILDEDDQTITSANYEIIADWSLCDLWNDSKNDADFIARAREDIPALLDELERLNARAEKAEDELQHYHDIANSCDLMQSTDCDFCINIINVMRECDKYVARAEQAERERDAAIADLKSATIDQCFYCAHNGEDYPDHAPHCDKCMKPNWMNGGVYCSGEQWQWRGAGGGETQ